MGNTIMNTQGKLRYGIVRRLLGDCSNKQLVDIGAGGNPISRGVKTKKTITIDAVKKYNSDIVCDFSKKIPLTKNSVDVIIAGEIIEHMFSPYRFVKELNRLLKLNGELILTTPNLNSIKNRIKVFLGFLPESCAEPLEDESYERHVVDFNFSRLEKLLRECGFKVVSRKTNGIISHSKLWWPVSLTPATFGESIILKAIKVRDVKSSEDKENFEFIR